VFRHIDEREYLKVYRVLTDVLSNDVIMFRTGGTTPLRDRGTGTRT